MPFSPIAPWLAGSRTATFAGPDVGVDMGTVSDGFVLRAGYFLPGICPNDGSPMVVARGVDVPIDGGPVDNSSVTLLPLKKLCNGPVRACTAIETGTSWPFLKMK